MESVAMFAAQHTCLGQGLLASNPVGNMGAMTWPSRERLGNWFSIKFKPLTFIEHLLYTLMVIRKGQHMVGFSRINKRFVRKKPSAC